ncbi:MAG: multiheme c-type cytochrome, partial [Thermodesulfobacteriota bacterium]
MKKVSFLLAALALLLMANPVGAAYYVGSDQCFKCHMEQFNEWQASGHPWKIREVSKARYAKLPLPPGYAWDDISYVIGGAIRKARFIDLEGYVITSAKDGSEAKTQYNLLDGSWSFYHKGEKKPYKCGPCHMTNYSPEGNQDGRPGMIGTWVEDGIGCEECHGPGSAHTKKPSKATIKVDKSAKGCGKCHQRGGISDTPPAKKGFIRHHEQINELYAGPHSDMDCVQCHNPHQRAILTKDACSKCHEGKAASYKKTRHGKTGLGCISCHMPKATKSAVAFNKYTGDMRTHIFKINTDPKANMFGTKKKKGGKKSSYAKGFVTLDFVCLGCHLS